MTKKPKNDTGSDPALPDEMVKAWSRAAKAWTRAAAQAAEDPEAWIKAWEDGWVAWLDHVVQSPPALTAMFAPLATGLSGLAGRNRMSEQWMHLNRAASLSDAEAMLNMLRRIESQILDLSDRLENIESRLTSMENAPHRKRSGA